MSDFYTVNRHDLDNIEILLDSEHENDWIQLFIHHEDGFTYSQFNEEHDLTDTRKIRISSDLAFKIWAMVESIDPIEVKKLEIQQSKQISIALGD